MKVLSSGSCYIDGTFTKGGGAPFQSYNPSNGTCLWEGTEATPQDTDRAMIAAQKAFPEWRDLSYQQRTHYLTTFTTNLKNQSLELAKILSAENGKPLWEARAEIDGMINKLTISRKAYEERTGTVRNEVSGPGGAGGIQSVIRHRPHGVIAVFGPYNFPGHLPNGHIIPALLAGNTVILKPSEQTPYISEKIMELWHQANLPPGVLQLIQGGAAVGKNLAEQPSLNGIFFTGSSQTGLSLTKTLLTYPGRILALEMGGNNPLIVCSSGNIQAKVYHTVQSAYLSSGQRCTCARRLIVINDGDGKGKEFVSALIRYLPEITVAPHSENNGAEPFMGPLISRIQAKKVLEQQQQLLDLGAKPLLPCKMRDDISACVTPGLIDVSPIPPDQQPDAEIFGPLLQLTWAQNLEEAISLANNTVFGLSAGILSEKETEFHLFQNEIRAGIVNWNRPLTGASGQAPFGGIGQSGNHRPSAYYAADSCAYPVAGLESETLCLPEQVSPGLPKL